MQTFGEWLDARLTERGWTAADLTRASQTPQRPRGFDSGLISRWRRPPPQGSVPRNARTLSELAQALGVPESEVYTAVGLLPQDVQPEEQPVPGDAIDRTIQVRMQQFASIVASYPRALRVAVIEANIRMAEAFKSLALEPDNGLDLSGAGSAEGPLTNTSQAPYNGRQQGPNAEAAARDDHLTASKRWAPALVGTS